MLEIKNLTCGYNSKVVLKDLNFKIESGELVGIIGPNGSGKTTLLRSIAKVLKPKMGEVMFEDRNIWQMGFKELAQKIAVVTQTSLTNFMTVEEFVLLGRIPYYARFQFIETKRDMKIARRCMLLTDTFKLRGQLIQEISGGERQLALIARALTQELFIII